MGWAEHLAPLSTLSAKDIEQLNTLVPMQVPAGKTLFAPGQPVHGYVVVLSGRVNVTLAGANGRELLLYAVEPGQSCIQTTLGLMSGDDYSAEAETASDCRIVIIPKPMFLEFLSRSDQFRTLVFSAMADRMQTMMHLLEMVAFQRLESRLAALLLNRAGDSDQITTTQAELANALGSAREVISRRLENWARRGWVKTGRGTIAICDADALKTISEAVA